MVIMCFRGSRQRLLIEAVLFYIAADALATDKVR